MLDFIIFFNTIVETFKHVRRPLVQALAQPVLTALLLIGLYGAYHIVRESSIGEGLWVAFIETDASRIQRLRGREDAILQAEMQHLADSNKIIDRLLESLLEHAPNAARTRLDVVHNGLTGVTGVGLLRYDATNSVAGAGHAAGSLVQNRPLTEWGDFLHDLLSGECRTEAAGELRSDAIRTRFETLNVGTIAVCPVADFQGRLLGAIFIFGDVGTRMPNDQDMDALFVLGKLVGRQIATVLDLRTPENWPALHNLPR